MVFTFLDKNIKRKQKKGLNYPLKEQENAPFSFRDKLGYLFGDLGNDFTFILSSSFLMKFYTDVMEVPAAAVGTVMMLARFIDAFTDVTMGRICDRSPTTKNGKFRPWLRRMCGPVAISSFLIYQASLRTLPVWAKIAYLFVTYILWGSVFYTSINIPYGSMASVISQNPDDRQSLSTYRTMGGIFAGAFISAGIPLLAFTRDEALDIDVINPTRFTVIAGVCSLLAVVCYLLCYSLTTERVKLPPIDKKDKENSVVKMISNAVQNRALISIIVASVFMLLSQLTMQQMANYVYPINYSSASMITLSSIFMTVIMLFSALVSKKLSSRFGKAELSVAANLFSAAVNLILFFVRPGNAIVFMVFQSISWLGLGIFSMVNWALITDVIDYSELKNGVREDGSVYALYSFSRKLGQAASSGVSGALLSLIGYTTPQNVTQGIKDGIFTIATLVPALGLIVLSLILWFWYPLKKKVVLENIRQLENRNKE